MITVIKSFNELEIDEFYEIAKLRISVFVVEQQCPYQEIDDIDRKAFHVYLKDEDGIIAYLRLFADDTHKDTIHIGRVLTTIRRKGLGISIVQQGISYAKTFLSSRKIEIEAQYYTRELYKKLGFVEISEVFLLDGIEHIKMELTL